MYNKIVFLLILILLNGCTSNSKLESVLQLVKNEYVHDINQTQLTDNSIRNLLTQLDPHTVYLTRKDLERFLILTTGHFGGIGISMNIQNRLLTIIAPITNTPAKAAGIKSGDIIIKINNHPTLGLNMEECVALTKGKVGTNLKLTILRKGEPKPLHFTIKRAYINTNPVFATLLNNSILYIHIATFNTQTSSELAQILTQYSSKKGIVLDLRYNPGGILNQAIATVDMFINQGIIVKQKGRLGKYTESYYATKESIDTTTPIAILINKGSASASEIVSGALQIHKRAIIIGEKSFGKGSVQTLFTLDNDSALKMTIAKYYLPDGKCIDKIGIKPDIIVKNSLHIKKRKQPISYHEVKKILKKLTQGSLSVKYIKSPILRKKTSEKNILTSKQIQGDKQLLKAIHIIKNSN